MGVAKQIPQLQPKAKERKSKKEEYGRGLYRRGRAGEGPRTLGGRGKVGGRGSERVNGEKNYKNISFKYAEVLNL
jgi:hypothetical protein